MISRDQYSEPIASDDNYPKACKRCGSPIYSPQSKEIRLCPLCENELEKIAALRQVQYP